MPIIKIQPESIRQNSNRISQTANDLTSLHWEINRLANQLDWEVRCRGSVESKISHAASMGKALSEETKRLSEYLQKCAAAFEEADSQGQQCISAAASNAVKNGIGTGAVLAATVGGAGVLAGLIAGGATFGTSALNWIKGIFGWGNRADTSNEANIIENVNTENASSNSNWPQNAVNKNLIYPIQGTKVVQGFPSYSFGGKHNGIDIIFDDASQSREIRAASDCTANFSVMMGHKDGKYFMYGLGNNVTLNCTDGLAIEYAHLSDFSPEISAKVQEKLTQMGITELAKNTSPAYWSQSEFGNGRIMLDVGPITVKAGQNIGTVGSTGAYAGNAPVEHLHLGVKQNGVYVDPRLYFGI